MFIYFCHEFCYFLAAHIFSYELEAELETELETELEAELEAELAPHLAEESSSKAVHLDEWSVVPFTIYQGTTKIFIHRESKSHMVLVKRNGNRPLLRYSKLMRLFYIRKYLDRKCRESKKEKKTEMLGKTPKLEKTPLSCEPLTCRSKKKTISEGTPEVITFEELGVESWLIKISKSVQINYPTKIQQLCLPYIMKGNNVIATSETGTGKTICYCWSILQELNKNLFGIFALVLLPTRELVIQVIEQFFLYGFKVGIKAISCIGGFSLIEQRKSVLAKPHIIVGTPGRMSDIINNCEDVRNCFKRLEFLVLDEADLLLQKCYEMNLKIILENLPKSGNQDIGEGRDRSSIKRRRTLLFSSTITDSLNLLLESFPNDNLILVNANKKQKPLKNLDQRYIYIDEIAQLTYLVYLLRNKLADQSGIIFTDNCYRCELIYTVLSMLGKFSVESIHSSKDPKKRLATLAKVKNGFCKILVATDIISRGIDIPKTSFVINFDFPNDAVLYIHRIGRTARANRKGLAISFVDKRDINSFNHVKQIMKTALKLYRMNKKEVLQDMFKIGRVLKKAEMLLKEREDVRLENRHMQRFLHDSM
ncbi:DEAD/DEAH box helicase domain containing protein [Plasmodium gonderi]|uniref:DEAD/DEAH box helicase domain containing protein n=1 Tax=Plasmodium gonderi TaxID=77519 RepID=A0A1Y1JIA5_PLAGO|nr:DEAD/DEAH box helicase domain containing protein [Plasmodium gonderi]GAW82241.1 DEAD/DEAH box helicase domain containing protein [Plasmodium gonderi]